MAPSTTGCRKSCQRGRGFGRRRSPSEPSARIAPCRRCAHTLEADERAGPRTEAGRGDARPSGPASCRRSSSRRDREGVDPLRPLQDPARRASSLRASISVSATSPGRCAAASSPTSSRRSEDKVVDLAFQKIDLRDGAALERDRPYLVPLIEELSLPATIRGKANPKSSTGRLDVFTRVITDGNPSFDEVPYGYQRQALPRGRPALVRDPRQDRPRPQPAAAVHRRSPAARRGDPRPSTTSSRSSTTTRTRCARPT